MSTIWTPGGERPVPEPERPATTSPPPGGTGSGPPMGRWPGGEPDAEEQAEMERELAAMQDEVASTPAAVVVANHAVGLFQLAAIHLNQRPPNLDEGQLAIDAMGALMDGIAGRLGDEEQSLRDGLGQLRMAFVQLSGGADAAAGEPPG